MSVRLTRPASGTWLVIDDRGNIFPLVVTDFTIKIESSTIRKMSIEGYAGDSVGTVETFDDMVKAEIEKGPKVVKPSRQKRIIRGI